MIACDYCEYKDTRDCEIWGCVHEEQSVQEYREEQEHRRERIDEMLFS